MMPLDSTFGIALYNEGSIPDALAGERSDV
jgi:hypothetical protein